MSAEIALLRHTLATLAYRGGKVLRGAPPEFADFRAADTTRSPGQILAHLGDLLDWALASANGQPTWQDSEPLNWEDGAERFFTALGALDKRLAAETAPDCSPQQLFQGPIADSLTHVGQIALLRRMAGYPVRAENYLKADIATGRVGRNQTPPKMEF